MRDLVGILICFKGVVHDNFLSHKVKSKIWWQNFILDYGSVSDIINMYKNMTNIQNEETQVTVGDSGTPNGMKCKHWHR